MNDEWKDRLVLTTVNKLLKEVIVEEKGKPKLHLAGLEFLRQSIEQAYIIGFRHGLIVSEGKKQCLDS